MDMVFRTLTPSDVALLLKGSSTAIRAEIEALPADLARWHPAPGEWCALEVLGHLVETECRGYADRIRHMLAEDEPRFRAWDHLAVAAGRRDCQREPAALLEEFVREREDSLALVVELGQADLGRAADHPEVGRLTVCDLLHEWVHHDRNHLRQLLANAQAAAWPHMGNAQRFTAG